MKIVKKLGLYILMLVLVISGSVCTNGVDVHADPVVRSTSDYSSVNFDSMSLAEYCFFFVQDLNVKYQEGYGCTGTGRSDYSTIKSFGGLEDVALGNLNGADYGIDCSSMVYIIGRKFGSKADSMCSADWEKETVGNGLREARIPILDSSGKHLENLDKLEIGDVIIQERMNHEDGNYHALIYAGVLDGMRTLVHIGSSHTCRCSAADNGTCSGGCVVTPGVGITYGASCEPYVNGSDGQHKRFIRTANADTFFSDTGEYTAIWIYKPIYDRAVGADATEEAINSFGSGAGYKEITVWTHKTGTLKEESAIYGLPGYFEFGGEPITLAGRDGLGTGEKANLVAIGEAINLRATTVGSVINTVCMVLGMVLILYAFLILLGYVFDMSNNFIDFRMLSVLSMGRWEIIDDQDITKSFKKGNKVFLTKTAIIFRAILIGLMGMVLVSGILLEGVGAVINMLYR